MKTEQKRKKKKALLIDRSDVISVVVTEERGELGAEIK